MNKALTLFLFLNLIVFCSVKAETSDSTKLNAYISKLQSVHANDVDSLVSLTDAAAKSLTLSKDNAALLRIYQKVGAIFSSHGYLSLAENYYTEAINLAKKVGNKPVLVEVTNSMGVVWGRKGDFKKAESFFLNALVLAKKINDVEGTVGSYFKLGVVRARQGKPDEALHFYKKVDSINKKHHSRYLENDLINNKAVAYAMKGDMKNALTQFELAYSFAIKENRITNQIVALQNIALVYKEKGDYPNAFSYLESGINLAKSKGLKGEELRIAINVPILLGDQGNFEFAENKFLALLEKTKEQDLEDLQLEIYDNLTKMAEAQKSYKRALDYHKEFSRLKNQGVSEQEERSFAQANASLKLYQKNAELLTNKNLLFQKTKERNILLIISAFCILLLLGVLVVSLRLKKLNKKLNVKKEELTESNTVKNKLFSIIGHDLRGAQGATLGILGLIQEGELSEAEQQKYVDMIIKQSQSALAILDDLLLWGQSQIKGQGFKKSEVLINEVVENTLDFNTEVISEKKINISTAGLEHQKVKMDANHLSFVIRNLIANALKFTPHGGNVKIHAEVFGKKLFKICVIDDGIGIAEEDIHRIFSPESISKHGTNNEQGTGLGLMLCKEFIELNGGKIWAERNPVQGSTFCFTCEKA